MHIPAGLKDFKESAGVLPFVFDDMPAGSRAAWSCKWVTRQGIIQSGEWGAVESMQRAEVLAELQDLSAREHPQADEMLRRTLAGEDFGGVLKWLRQSREFYPEYIYPPDPPERAYLVVFRPGWGETEVKSAWEVI